MPQLVVSTAQLTCVAGTAPSVLVVTPENKVMSSNMPAATIMDNIPMKNIMPFGTCNILTASASGVPTPCVPATAAPWAPGSVTVMIGNKPALNNTCKLICSIGGVINVVSPGQMTTSVA